MSETILNGYVTDRADQLRRSIREAEESVQEAEASIEHSRMCMDDCRARLDELDRLQQSASSREHDGSERKLGVRQSVLNLLQENTGGLRSARVVSTLEGHIRTAAANERHAIRTALHQLKKAARITQKGGRYYSIVR